MMDILEKLNGDLADLEKQQEQTRANALAISGAIQYVKGFIEDLENEESESIEGVEEDDE